MSTVRTALLTALAPAVWGTTYAVTTQWLPEDRPLLAAMLRALPAGLVLLAVGHRLPRGSWWWRAAVLGTLNIGAFFALLFVSAYRLPGGVAATLGAVQPLVVAGLAAALLAERVRLRTALAGLAGVTGIALLVLRADARLDGAGLAAGLAGTVCVALGMVLTRRWGRPVPLLTFTGWQLAAGGLVLVPVVLAVEGLPAGLTAQNVGGFAYLGVVGTAAAYALWFRGLERLPVAAVSFLGLLSPVVATVVGWIALGEGLTAGQLAGMVLALAGLAVGATTPRTPVAPDAVTDLVPDLRRDPLPAPTASSVVRPVGAAC
ncbi:EamA family transporter [Georgenia sp. M64]|uniref:EamA family transporter n=1 Tax=Georgenia sp. M64 TaxID=3120520 RepID=UPI0030E327AC